MYIFGFMWKRLRQLWRPSGTQQAGIDSHKWESKIESIRSLSRERYVIPEIKDKCLG
jgi:hypothetical protein